MKLILFILLLSPSLCFSQGFLDCSKSRVQKRISKYFKHYHYQSATKQTDSTITLVVRDSGVVRPFDVVVHFDRNGKSDTETWVYDCDSCLKIAVQRILSKRYFKWQQLNEPSYVSSFFWRTGLYIDEYKPSYTFIHIHNRKEYERLLLNKDFKYRD